MPAKPIRKRSFVKAPTVRRRCVARLCPRVQGDEQNNALQTKALKAAGCRRLFEEAASGGRGTGPSCTECWTICAKAIPSLSGSSIVCHAH